MDHRRHHRHPGATNWRTDATSNIDTDSLPGATTNVTFTTTNPAANNYTASSLNNTAFTINSLTFNGGNSLANPIGIISGGASGILTINATNANGNTAGNGITLSSAVTPNVTISAPIVLGVQECRHGPTPTRPAA